MLVLVAEMFEEGGRPLPRHRAVTLAPSHQGVLSLYEEYDRDLRRSVRKAKIDSISGQPLLMLHDAVVLFCQDGVMTITGMERDALTRKVTAQSWYIEIVDVRKREELRAHDANS